MKQMKHIMLVVMLFAAFFTLLDCNGAAESCSKHPNVYKYNTISIPYAIYVDPETRVQYIVFDEQWGFAGGLGITPRLDANGKPMLLPEGEPLK